MSVRLALLAVYFATLLSGSIVYGAASSWPAPLPLFHKSPYLNAWVEATSNVSSSPADRWPQFFHLKDLGWFIGVRVDNISYMIQGDDLAVNYTAGSTVSTYILPSQTRFTIAAGPVLVNLTYLAPIELQDWTLHSFPFTYAAFDIISSDSKPHAVQLYTDTAVQFVSSDDSNMVKWNTSFTAQSIYHMSQQTTLQILTENNDMSEDGTQILAYSATPGASVTWQTCFADYCRGNFTLHGNLENTSDTNYRSINDNWPVLAYALELGNITKTSDTLVFAMGLTRDPVVSYRTAQTTQSLSHLWHSRWSNVESAIDEFLGSYASAASRADALDDRIQLNATALASQLSMSTSATTSLVDLHILNLRQIVGSLEFTTLEPSTMDNVRVFMKDVGYSRRTNPVEIIYASFPAFLFLNTTLAGKLLEPLLEFQGSTLYKNNYAAPDLGSGYPVVQGNATDQSLLAIDSCGAMLIMALAHARKSGDGTLLFTYYDLLRQWADYLVQSTQQPGSYMSSDGLYSSTANLAFKGIMGLYAMGKINNILEARGADASKTSYYLNTANAYAKDWLNEAISSDHIMASYGANSTWAMMYNLFAPRLLGAAIIPDQIYETQASWYTARSESAATFGLPYDGTQALAKSHWTLLSASSVYNATSSAARDGLIQMVHARSFWQAGQTPNPATYSPIDGTLPGGAASPAMGAIYSMLALNLPDLTITLPSGSLGSSQSTGTHVPVIVGATLGALGGLILLASAILFFLRRRRMSKDRYPDERLVREELRPRYQGAANVTPFTHEIRPFTTNGLQEQQLESGNVIPDAAVPARLHPTRRLAEKSGLMVLSHDTTSRNLAMSMIDRNSGVEGGSSSPAVSSNRDGEDDAHLRREVEHLRRAVETLSAQQQPPQVIYQEAGGLADDPPPMYPS